MVTFFWNEKFLNNKFTIILKYGKIFFISEKMIIMARRSCYFVSLMLVFLWLNLLWRRMNSNDIHNSRFSYV